MRRLRQIAGVLILGMLVGTGCQYLCPRPIYCLSLHLEVRKSDYAEDTLLIQPVVDVNGKNEHVVSRYPMLDSSSFGDVELVKGPGLRWGLRMKMDRKGVGLWRQATGEHCGRKLVVLLDGFVSGEMTIPTYEDNGYIILPPLWTEAEARAIASHVRRNYEIANHKY